MKIINWHLKMKIFMSNCQKMKRKNFLIVIWKLTCQILTFVHKYFWLILKLKVIWKLTFENEYFLHQMAKKYFESNMKIDTYVKLPKNWNKKNILKVIWKLTCQILMFVQKYENWCLKMNIFMSNCQKVEMKKKMFSENNI